MEQGKQRGQDLKRWVLMQLEVFCRSGARDVRRKSRKVREDHVTQCFISRGCVVSVKHYRVLSKRAAGQDLGLGRFPLVVERVPT